MNNQKLPFILKRKIETKYKLFGDTGDSNIENLFQFNFHTSFNRLNYFCVSQIFIDRFY